MLKYTDMIKPQFDLDNNIIKLHALVSQNGFKKISDIVNNNGAKFTLEDEKMHIVNYIGDTEAGHLVIYASLHPDIMHALAEIMDVLKDDEMFIKLSESSD